MNQPPYLLPWVRVALLIRSIRMTTFDEATWPTANGIGAGPRDAPTRAEKLVELDLLSSGRGVLSAIFPLAAPRSGDDFRTCSRHSHFRIGITLAPGARFGPRAARLIARRAGYVRIIVDVPDLQPGRASYTVASYVRATLKLRALRRELAQAVLDVARCKKALASRGQAAKLLAEAQELLEELGVEADAQ